MAGKKKQNLSFHSLTRATMRSAAQLQKAFICSAIVAAYFLLYSQSAATTDMAGDGDKNCGDRDSVSADADGKNDSNSKCDDEKNCNEGDSNADGKNDSSNTSISAEVSSLRASLRPSYPEINVVYSDAYLAAVLSVPHRTYEYARDEKITKALEWRRSYGVDDLTAAFRYDDEGEVFIEANENDSNKNRQSLFVPSQSLIDVCLSGALSFGGFDEEGRGILHAKTALLDFWKTGVDDGIRYHVLIIEHALKMLLERNKHNIDNEERSESLVLYVDTSDQSLFPPPMGSLTGMAGLMQQAYPDRIHKIYVGPVNVVLRALYELVSPHLRPRSRDKIVLLETKPPI